MRRVAWAASLLTVMMVSGCGQPTKQAAPDVRAFLTAVRAGDRQAFEARIDRAAVRRDLRGQLVELGRAAGVEVDGGPSEFALDRMINPENVRLSGPIPAEADLRRLLKRVDDKRVCVPDRGPNRYCLLTFERQKAIKGGRSAGWRLVRMPAAHVTIDITPPPKKG